MPNETVSKENLSKHTSKIKEYEKNAVQIIKNYKDNVNQEMELNDALEQKINNIQDSIIDVRQNIRTMMCDKSHTQTEILYLREMCDKVNTVCCDIEIDLALATDERDVYDDYTKKIENLLEEKRKEGENLLKSENDTIEKITNEINKYNQLIANAQQEHFVILNTLQETHNKTENDLKSLMENNTYLENKMLDTEKEIQVMKEKETNLHEVLTQRKKEQEMIITAMEQNKVTFEEEFLQVNNVIETKLKDLQDINSNVEKLKMLIEQQESISENLLKESVKLKYERKYYVEKYMEQEKTMAKQENDYLEDYNKLKCEIELLSQEILSKEDILITEQKLEEEAKKNINELDTSLKECLEKNQILENDLRSLETEKNNLLQSIADEKNAVDCLNANISKANEEIGNLETNWKELETQMVNCEMEHKTETINLQDEIQRCRNDAYAKCQEIDTARHAIEQEQTEPFNKEENCNKEYIEVEKEIEEIERTIAKYNEEKKQLITNLDSRTLECDIFARKIKFAQDLRQLKKEELMPKPTVEKLIGAIPKKRQFDETSESSFEEGMRFADRIKKKALKKAAVFAKKT